MGRKGGGTQTLQRVTASLSFKALPSMVSGTANLINFLEHGGWVDQGGEEDGKGGRGVVREDKNIHSSLKQLRESWIQRKTSPSVRISCKLSKANEGSDGTVSIRI
jgi:hypothetical protein